MKAVAECPRCGEKLTTDCRGCIESGTAVHKCNDQEEIDLIEVKWKVFPETEEELNKIEDSNK